MAARTKRIAPKDTVEAWASIARRVRAAVRGLGERQLDRRGGSEGWSIRRYVHHLAEANLVASTIVIAAIGSPGCTFDWSWLIPDEAWMRSAGYDRVPLGPALRMLEALSRHVAALLVPSTALLRRPVVLIGSGGRKSGTTVAAVLADEIAHAEHHLADIAAARGAAK
ncbi:MAG TPA: maleylpyruvate isomerase N-terminal domain-containing protein [Thermoanaerobaculia bacterium]|nr:maleylpyruvate isomerase N-terminal domain-containing protein [Thermoanaerobaculia bacterium]